MVVSFCTFYVVAVLINKVSLEVTLKGSVGKPVVLPCLYTEDKDRVQTVIWVHDDNNNVYEFSPGSISQEAKYSNRVKSFPEKYKDGNYSIKIKILEKTDEGEYTCIITPADHYESMRLIIESNGDEIIEETERSQIRPEIIAVIVLLCCVLNVTVGILWWKKMCIFKRR